ncbi:hypothetical protein M1105_17405 [Limibaculum sp. FT325]|uniref:hypothetical protein n=1 Tax=Thermohalobaculum sediminis TaxID=2939436 RepID=UPI0020BEF6D2|nr:hypothetical protein [Limibaculum sediminis]MCL5778756.1 hypothetical protein [Limibaculum sediminis]
MSTARPKPAAGDILGLDPRDARIGTGFAVYARFARSGAGRLISRGTWLAIGAAAVAVFVVALVN